MKNHTLSGDIPYYDVIIAGGGPAGLAAALSFAEQGRTVCVIERTQQDVLENPPFDGREIAMTHHTCQWLKEKNIWDKIPKDAICPLETARVESGRTSHSALLFSSQDKASLFHQQINNDEPLGYLVSNHLIRKSLYETVKDYHNITILCHQSVVSFRNTIYQKDVFTSDNRHFSCELLIAADGRFSQIRQKAGIGAIIHDFHREILVCRMSHKMAHNNVALQWFDKFQTIALLPVASDKEEASFSSLVLTLPSNDIEYLKALSKEEFAKEITQRTHKRLGELTLVSKRISYPLKAVYAHRFYEGRLALIGDAAVGMHPITAHGFNFGIRAQEILASEIAKGNGDAGDKKALKKFERRLRLETMPLFTATNAIAVTYTRDEEVFMFARDFGLKIANKLKPLKHYVVNKIMSA